MERLSVIHNNSPKFYYEMIGKVFQSYQGNPYPTWLGYQEL